MTPKALSAQALDECLAVVPREFGVRDDLRAHIAALEADNAALANFVSAQAHVECDGAEQCGGACGPCIAKALRDQPHPGAALLERHEKEAAELTLARDMLAAMHEAAQKARLAEQADHAKALVRARNEGLESAADLAWSNDPDSDLADAIRRKKEPEQ